MASTQSQAIVSRAALARLAAQWRRQRKRIVFTNGVFDILHRAHLDLFEYCRKQGDIVVVGINSDASTQRLKGPSRPVNKQRDRARLVAALKPVDCVCLFGEDTPLKLIQTLRPDILVKGSEYAAGAIVGASEVKSWGGTVKRFRMRPGYSSTRTLTRMRTPARKS